MTSRSGALIAPPSWGRALHPVAAERIGIPRTGSPTAAPRVRWGIRAPVRSDLAGAAILAATAGLWAAFLLAAW